MVREKENNTEDINELHSVFDAHKFPRTLQFVIFQYVGETILLAQTTKINKTSHSRPFCCWCIFLFSFFSSVAMIVFGCNPNVPGGCLMQVIAVGNVTNYNPTMGICCSLSQANEITNCENNDYSCCDVAATLSTPMGTCECDFYSTHDCNSTAKIGTTIEVVMNKYSNKCVSSVEGSRTLWVLGVCGLTLSGVVLCCFFLEKFQIQKMSREIDLTLFPMGVSEEEVCVCDPEANTKNRGSQEGEEEDQEKEKIDESRMPLLQAYAIN